MGKSVTGQLTLGETQFLGTQAQAMGSIGQAGAATGKFNFFAGFDGTLNDRNNVPDGEYPTNVANLVGQAEKISGTTGYYPGIGTGGVAGNLWDAALSPTQEVHAIANVAYDEFVDAARAYKTANPNATPADFTASIVGFSRGTASAVVFAQLLNERGLTAADGTVLAPPGSIKVDGGMVLLDPVHTFINGDMRIPPNVEGNVLVVRAQDESRTDFRSVDYSNDDRVVTVDVRGNHAGVGGGYDLTGTGAAVLEGATAYYQTNGTPIAPVPPELRLDTSTPADLYTEAFQVARNGDVLVDENGNPRFVWRVDEGSRQSTEPLPAPGAPYVPQTTQPSQEPSTTPGNPASLAVVEIDGQTYTYTSLGTLDRALPGQPGWTESRDSTGGGIIRDADGNVVAQLQAGDSVGMTDDGRISITNELGQTVDRVVDQVAAGEFLLPTTPDLPPPQTGNYSEYLNTSGLSPSQQQALGQWLDGAGVGGVDNVGFVPLPGSGTVLLQNADGDIVGEITVGANGVTQVRGIDGEPTYITSEGQTLSAEQYVQQQSQVQDQYNAQQARTALGLLQNIIGLENWEAMSDGQRAAVLVGMYNGVDALSGGELPGNLGNVTAVLGFINALESGDDGATLYSSIALIDQVAEGAASQLIGETLNIPAVDVLPVLNLVLALDSGDPVSIAAAAVAFIPGVGPALSLVINVVGMLRDPPRVEGQASMGWDDQGQLVAQVDSSRKGGGAIAQTQAEQLGVGLEQGLQTQQQQQGIPPEQQVALNPEHMPVVGYHSQFETIRHLSWTDQSGQTHTRYYDANGRHPSGSTMAQDYVQMVVQGGALAPAWLIEGAQNQYSQISQQAAQLEAQIATLQQQAQALGPQTVRHSGGEGGWEETIPAADPAAHAQVLQDIEQLQAQAGALRQQAQGVVQALPSTQDLYQQGQLSEDGLSQTLSVITLEMPGATTAPGGSRTALINLDADAYLEQSQWVSANQAVLGIDHSGNGRLEANELLHGDLAWLDSNGDGRIDASDPAYGAVKLWLDVNGDGQSAGEAQALAQTQISAIVIAEGGMHIERADGSTQGLSEQNLTGATQGVIYGTHQDAAGLLRTTEQADGSGQTELLAANTHKFDGQAEHTHGGLPAGGAGVQQEVRIDEGDARLTSTTFKTADSASTQTHVVVGRDDANWQDGQAGQVLSGQLAGQQTQVVLGSDAVHSGPVVGTEVWTTDSGVVVVSEAPAQTPAPEAREWHTVDVAPAQPAVPLAPAANTQAPEVTVTVLAGQASGEQTEQWVSASALQSGSVGEVLSGQVPGSVAQPAHAGNVADNGQVFRGASGAMSAASVVAAGDIRIISALVSDRQRGPVVFVPTAAGTSSEAWLRSRDELLNSASSGAWGGSSGPMLALAAGLGTAGTLPNALAGSVDQVSSSSTAVAALQDSAWMGLAGAEGLTAGGSLGVAPVTGPLPNAAGGGVTSTLPERQVPGDSQALVVDGAARWPSLRAQNGAEGTTGAPEVRQGDETSEAPWVVGELVHGLQNQPLLFSQAALLANDINPGASTGSPTSGLQIVAVESGGHGTVEMTPEGQVLFTPAPNHVGSASFNYTVMGQGGTTSTATVYLDLEPMDASPTVRGEDVAGLEDSPLWLDAAQLLANDVGTDAKQENLQVTWVGKATHGTVTLDADGRIQFVPDENFNSDSGVATFAYTVSDGAGGTTTGVARVVLAPVNDAPVAVGETAEAVPEDTVMVFRPEDLLANDSDVDMPDSGQALSISAVGNAQHGEVALRDDGAVVFTPEVNYVGPARFSYTVDDGAGGQARAWVDVAFTAVNDAPLAGVDTVQATEDKAVVVRVADLLANDSDPDGPTEVPQLVWVGDATHGQVERLPDGDIRFEPDRNFEGTAGFRYRVEDGQGGLTETTVLVQVAAVNDLPVAANDRLPDQTEDVPLVITAASLLGNDVDEDVLASGQVLRITGVESLPGQTHGAVSLDDAGNVRFVPEAHYAGEVCFAYTVEDGQGGSAQAQASFNVNNVNDAPVLTGELLVAKQQSELYVGASALLANDRDVDTPYSGDVLTLVSVGNAENGTATLLEDGRIHFVFDPAFSGVGRFDYVVGDGQGAFSTATAQVSNVNMAPVVVGETLTLREDTVATVAPELLLANDSDPDNQAADLRILSVGNATHGSISMNAQGAMVFTPELNYFGDAEFTYTVGDGEGGLAVGIAKLDIQSVNDAPELVGEHMRLEEDQIAHIAVSDLLANDRDVDGPAPLGLVAVGNATGGSVVLSGESVVFTPALNFDGVARFTYSVSDGAGGVSQAQVQLQIDPVNDAPVANNEHISGGHQGQVFEISSAALLANDVDPESTGQLRLTQVMDAQHGSVSLESSGVVRFVPDAGYAGVASFAYEIADPEGLTSVGRTTIDFQRLNLTPTAVDDSFNGVEDVPFLISASQLLSNDSDDGGAGNLSLTAVRAAVNGTAQLTGDGQVRFVPESNYNGPAQFQYQVSDTDGANTWATAYLAVAAVNDAPVIEAVWHGTPIYGYEHTWVPLHWDSGDSYWDATKVFTPAEALALGSELKDAARNSITPTYLPNSGVMAPIGFEQSDGGFLYGDKTKPLDDLSEDSGRVVAYDLDSPGSFTYSVIHDLTTHGGASVDSSGNWHYSSNALDPHKGADAFTIRVTDAQGASVDVRIDTYHAGKGYVPPNPNPDDIFVSPVAVDMGGDGLQVLSAEASAIVADMNGDGRLERVGWVGPEDAILVYDHNRDNQVDVTSEVSFVQYLPGATTDLEGLRAFDSNSNGFLDSGDSLWTDFGVWQDANGNGVQDDQEFNRLDDANVVSVSLVRTGTPEEINGNVVYGVSDVLLADGRTVQASDVMFRTVAEPAAAVAEAENAGKASTAEGDVVLPVVAVMEAAVDGDPKEVVGELPVIEPLSGDASLSLSSTANDTLLVSSQAIGSAQMGVSESAAADMPEVVLPGFTGDSDVNAQLSTSDADISRMAQLFNEWSSAVIDTDNAAPIAFVPSDDVAWGVVPEAVATASVANSDGLDQPQATGTSG